MKFALILLLFVAGVAEYACAYVTNLPLAKECDPKSCQLPNCRCSGTDIPGGFAPRDTPQFVTLTFDDAVTANNMITYRDLLYNRLNFNGCPVGATFYVTHEYTDYQGVNQLYNQGFEIALHSISHQTPQEYWSHLSYDDLKKELVDQVSQISYFANIPPDAVKGVRLPFLQMSGNTSFQLMADHRLLYDCSWPTTVFTDPPLWPYTLDYASIQDCNIPPCPTASIPGPWVLPMVSWIDPEGFPCSMVDACTNFPDREDENAWFEFILKNFERHYTRNRAPFPFYIHEGYLKAYPAVLNATKKFLNLINRLPDVYMVNSAEIIEWIQDPVPIPQYNKKPCRGFTPTSCLPTNCAPLLSSHNNLEYWMSLCTTCPTNYPWVGNPLGH